MLNYYNGSTVMTDAIGNTIYDGTFTYTWQHGRQLASAIKSGTTVSYKYNADGIRTSKTVNGILHTYDLSGSSIVRECIYNSTGTYVATELRYYYDAKGAPTAMRVFKRTSATATAQEFVCYFATNLQGDIVALYDEAGNRIASYTYDAWGNNIYKTSAATPDISATNAQWLMNINPFRYRGYYYDTETELYYLQSRYYNPLWGRFINADGYINANGDLIGFNMYAYCSNNPVNYLDENGEFAENIYWGICYQFSVSLYSYLGMAVASLWDDDIKEDMDEIGWNPFNSDASLVAKSQKVSFYKGAPVIRSNGSSSGSFGLIILSKQSFTSDDNFNWTPEENIKHEWGHCVQQITYGPVAYLIHIGIPSPLMNEDDEPWEIMADIFGGVSRSHDVKDVNDGWAYFFGARFVGPYWWW